MKYILIFLCLFSFTLFGQESDDESKKFNFGVNMGLNVSNVLVQDNDTVFSNDFSSRTSGHFGLKLMYNPHEIISIRSGFQLNLRGYKIKESVYFGSSTPTDIETVFSFAYIDIPFIAQINLMPDAENGSIFFRAGGYYGFAVGGGTATKVDDDDNSPRLQTTAQNFSIGNSKADFLRKEDYGITIGGGLGFRTFEIALVWDVGLANISNETSNGFAANNRLFRIDFLIFAL